MGHTVALNGGVGNCGVLAMVLGLRDETMLDSLRDKTRRGMRGQILRGFSAGGRPYGYRSIPVQDSMRKDAYGNPEIVGYRRAIHQGEAKVVHEIFELYAAGLSPKTIAKRLNSHGVPPPRPRRGRPARGWTWTTINGCPSKSIGILNNPIYVGRVVWNRSYKVRDPDSGRRITRQRDRAEWVSTDVPELRIIPDELWECVQMIRDERRHAAREAAACRQRAPKYLLSGLLVCGRCGAPYVLKTGSYYGCASNIDRGGSICPNTQLVRRDVIEATTLEILRTRLLHPSEIEEFVGLVNNKLAEMSGRRAIDRQGRLRELAQARQELENIKAAIRAGLWMSLTREALEEAEAKVSRLEGETVSLPAQVSPLTAEQVLSYVQDLPGLVTVDQDRAKVLLRRFLAPVVLNPTDDGIEAAFQINVAGVLELVGAGTGVRYDSFGAGRGI